MALTPAQQAQELLTRAASILVVAGETPSIDRLAAAVACRMFLEKQGKVVDVVVPGFHAEDAPSFLDTTYLRAEVGPLNAIHVRIDVHKTPLGELSYNVQDGRLTITVVPKTHTWQPNDVNIEHGDYRYDLIVALGAADRNALGALGREHADFLHHTPVLNIDCASTNEYWGQVNLVDLNAVSVTELLFRFFEHWDGTIVDAPLATALLAGMISSTKSFRTPNVTPKTLALASTLVARGAERERIVTSLWRTRSVETLKLWGRALTRLEHDAERALVWSVLTTDDFLESGGKPAALDGIIDELLAYAPDAKTVVLLSEPAPGKGIHLTIACQAPRSAAEIGKTLGATGTREHATAVLQNITLLDAYAHVLNHVRDQLNRA